MGSSIDHRKIRKMVEDRKSTIKEKDLFTSRLMAAHFEDINAASLKVYNIHRDVHVILVWRENDGFVACTDKQIVWLNAANTFDLEECSRKTRYLILQGENGHELGHILFTDFLAGQSYMRYFTNRIWYPSAPPADTPEDAEAIREIFEYTEKDPMYEKTLAKLVSNINNIIEDGYIEDRMLRYFPGTIGQGLSFARKLHFDSMPTLSEMIDEEKEGTPAISTILQLVLSYVKFGKLKYGDTPLSDDRVQFVFELLPVLDMAVQSGDVNDRLMATNLVLVKAWKYVKEFIENIDTEDDTDTDSASEKALSKLAKVIAALVGNSEEAKGNSEPVSDMGILSTASSSGTEEAREKTAELAAMSGAAGVSADSAEDENPSHPEDTEGGSVSEEGSSGSTRLNLGTIFDNEYEGAGELRAVDDLDKILEGIAERDTMRVLEEMRTSMLQTEANGLEYGDIHDGITVVIHRTALVSDDAKMQYHATAERLLQISKQLQRSIKQQLKDVQLGGKRTGLMMGRRIDTHALVRNDGKCFYKNSLPQEMPQLAVGLLLDESGSMWCSDRALYARYTAIVIYDFCRALGIPVTIYGHTTTDSRKYGHSLDMYSYAEFEGIDDDDKYRLMDITARSNNRDGMALRFLAEKLVRRPEQEKILILVSDGQPADDDYYGNVADEDLRQTVKEYTRKGLLFIAAAIGDDKPEIERIYGDAFMDISDLSTLPEKLTSVIKKHIRI